MSNYDDTNRGALFKNDRKEKDTHPDYRGPINVDGKELEIAAWLRESKNGKKYMSLSVGPKFVPESKQEDSLGKGPSDFDEDLPF